MMSSNCLINNRLMAPICAIPCDKCLLSPRCLEAGLPWPYTVTVP